MLIISYYYYNFILNFLQKKMPAYFNLSNHDSIANQFISELRDKNIQVDRARFRNNMKKLGQIMAYEISKKLHFTEQTVVTPLGSSRIRLPERNPVLLTILRAGLPYFEGFLDYFDHANCGFIGAYRDEASADIVIQLDYVSMPEIEGRELILIDPMLATGKSIVNSINKIIVKGKPSFIHIASLVAAPEGIDFVTTNVNIPYSLYTCAVDDNLNDQFYIVPGLGDAGDLSFGSKL